MYSIQLMMTDTQIKESRTAIQQAGSVKRLTVLAFIFIPISTVSSAFGMNVQQLTDNPPSIWISFAMMTTVTLVAIIFSSEITHDYYWALRKVLRPLIPHRDVPYNCGNVINDIPEILGFSEDITTMVPGFMMTYPDGLQISHLRSNLSWNFVYGCFLGVAMSVKLGVTIATSVNIPDLRVRIKPKCSSIQLCSIRPNRLIC